MPSLNIIIGEYSIYTHYSRQNSILCISRINFCNCYRIAQTQISRRAPARPSPRTAHGVVASASAAKFDTRLGWHGAGGAIAR
eukprot:6179014-Pleurochrysis_carterae.AAC.1